MKRVRALLADRSRRQRGSVLSGLLLTVALLSILIGALMTSLSSSFLISKTVSARVQREATDNSAVELALYQLANSSVPAVCARDARGPWYITSLNGSPAAVTETCTAIVPDRTQALAAGAYVTAGIHEVTAVHDTYIVGDQAGRLRSYPFGTTSPEWSLQAGGALTGPPAAQADPNDYPDVALLVPDAGGGGQCGGHCVALYNQRSSGTPSLVCHMPAGAGVTGSPGAEAAAGGSPHFPSYTFFGDSAGGLYVYDAATDGACDLQASAAVGGAIVGQPIVFTGTATSKGRTTTLAADIFVVVTSSNTTRLQEWQYVETTDKQGNVTKSLFGVSSQVLAVGGGAVSSGPSSAIPTAGTTIRIAVAGASGAVAIGKIGVLSSGSGPVYSVSAGPSATLGGGVAAAPYWCHCPGADAIGVGTTNGILYLLDPSNLGVVHTYNGQSAIRTTPTADRNGDWYFGADDGNVYDVEVPTTGVQLFKAAQFPGPGGAVRSSPIAGTCGSGPCVYFGSATLGSYFVQLGSVRVIDLRACVTSAPASVTCAANPRLWARAEIGSPAIVGGSGIWIQGWSYYSP